MNRKAENKEKQRNETDDELKASSIYYMLTSSQNALWAWVICQFENFALFICENNDLQSKVK